MNMGMGERMCVFVCIGIIIGIFFSLSFQNGRKQANKQTTLNLFQKHPDIFGITLEGEKVFVTVNDEKTSFCITSQNWEKND